MADIAVSPTDPGGFDQRERRRLAALVAADSALLDGLHADDFILVNPGGGEWDRAFYLGGIADGSIDYRRFDAVTPLRVMAGDGVAVVRYRSAIEIAVGGGPYVSLTAWHLDCYRHDERFNRWRCVWSQATRIDN